ncbi:MULTISPECIES: response regulator [Streptomyces]|uniref:response regulator n=1 Tax=Streptomyces TaxID=1883 RepID=UPI001291BC1F|nr:MULTISPECIES: response regulator [Streptomyces]MBQ0953054.1 response regulator [Streptomyces sp. RK76]
MTAHILVAEDDERQAQVLRMYLRSLGHDATVVHDGRARSTPRAGWCPDHPVPPVRAPRSSGSRQRPCTITSSMTKLVCG